MDKTLWIEYIIGIVSHQKTHKCLVDSIVRDAEIDRWWEAALSRVLFLFFTLRLKSELSGFTLE